MSAEFSECTFIEVVVRAFGSVNVCIVFLKRIFFYQTKFILEGLGKDGDQIAEDFLVV